MRFSTPSFPDISIIFEKMRQRVYIDTSVTGGYFDDEFKDVTLQLFKRWESGELIFVTSDLLDLELLHALRKSGNCFPNFRQIICSESNSHRRLPNWLMTI